MKKLLPLFAILLLLGIGCGQDRTLRTPSDFDNSNTGELPEDDGFWAGHEGQY